MAAVVNPAEETLRSQSGLLRLRPEQQPRTVSSLAAGLPGTEGGDPNVLEPTIYRFILKHSLRPQLLLLGLTLISFPFLYFSLDLPKTIVNRAIGGKQFPQMVIGYNVDQITYLLILCGLFLILVFVNGASSITSTPSSDGWEKGCCGDFDFSYIIGCCAFRSPNSARPPLPKSIR